MYYRFINETFEKLFSLKIHDKIPLFIIGPPRSGSTLLYQYLARYFDVSYSIIIIIKITCVPLLQN